MGVLGLVFSLWLENRMDLMPGLSGFALSGRNNHLFCGLILVVGRATALSQVIGLSGLPKTAFFFWARR